MTKKVIVSAFCDIQVQFYDVDPMRIVWHGNYVKYLEQARCVLFDKIDYGYLTMESLGHIWPIVDMRLKYVSSARFGDWVRVQADLVEYENRLKVNYIITDCDSGKLLTKAHTVQVAVDNDSQELLFESPAVFVEKLEKFIDA